ncbi:aldo/keto reductase [Dactylosporangium aurantiacum]|uniref:Aldo/keto reductase n=1 Tax=Dactylosporangium aurantiacum TaxID=35754 RepID=A0A9Q9MEK2_9ACTN|nr:aldo/keto reductase [Dactylosporangium aurantiacum]MDG6102320.1 aldo/keto reductase [Dactylosporangium aurantiacum]UWZ53379.1 aldo/keto reductase [Dactylosporangium aurantiacum]
MAHEIPTAELGPGVQLPTIGFGTWQITGSSAYESTRTALDVGYRHIDTATMYGNEDEIGRALRDSGVDRSDIFITTKLPPSQAGRERQTIEASLKALGVDHVDLWLIHWPPARGRSVPVWEAFLKAREAGLTRSVGVSNYDAALIDELTKETGETPAVNQVAWSPAQHDAQFLADMRDRRVVVEGYSSLKNTPLDDPRLVAIAEAHGVTVPQVVLRWQLHHDIVIIPKSTRRERMAENLSVLDFSLTAAELETVNAW